jgi:hypothetical protein
MGPTGTVEKARERPERQFRFGHRNGFAFNDPAKRNLTNLSRAKTDGESRKLNFFVQWIRRCARSPGTRTDNILAFEAWRSHRALRNTLGSGVITRHLSSLGNPLDGNL